MTTHPVIQIILFFSTLLSGSINTVAKKIQYQSCAPGLDSCPGDKNVCNVEEFPTNHPFSKPWIQLSVMFLAEFLCLPFHYIIKYISKKNEIAEKNEPEVFSYKKYLKEKLLFLILGILDLLGSIFTSIGLLFISSSIYQLFRGSIVIFTGIWSVLFLKRKLGWQSWLGIVLVVLGLCFVGVSGFLNTSLHDEGNSTSMSNKSLFVFGILMVIVGQFAASFQMVLEEKFLKEANISPLYMIGWEGIFGLFLTCAIAFPIITNIPGNDCNKYENVPDGFVMMGQSLFILVWNLVSLVSLCFFNGLGLTVSKYLSSVHRTLIDACRTIMVWVSMIIVCYTAGSQWGEPWEPFSYFEVIGFLFLALGTLLYNKVFTYEMIVSFFRRNKFTALNETSSEVELLKDNEIYQNDNKKENESLDMNIQKSVLSSYHAPNDDEGKVYHRVVFDSYSSPPFDDETKKGDGNF